MMLSPRRIGATLAVLLAAGYFLGARAESPPSPGIPAPVPGIPVELDTTAGKLTGLFRAPTVVIDADYGHAELDPAKLRSLDFTDRDELRGISVTLTNKNHFSGTLPPGTRFPVELPGGELREIAAGEVEQIRFLHPKDTSLLAVVIGLLTLTLMEIVLGVDNVIFLAIQAGKLPPQQRRQARFIGLGGALAMRIGLLLTLNFILGLTKPVFTLPAMPLLESAEARGISWRDIILLSGGAFLIAKSVYEMHGQAEHAETHAEAPVVYAGFWPSIAMIMVIDILFSLDSVITAVGMVEDVRVMITAMVIAMGVMLAFAGPIGDFVDRRPTVKILALSFLILIGVLLVADGLGQHLNKGYIYFAMAFAVGVELVNSRLRPKAVTA